MRRQAVWLGTVVGVAWVVVCTAAPVAGAALATMRASVDTGGGDSNNASYEPSISADGRYVAFQSYASDLVPGDGNGGVDIFVRDLAAGSTVRASMDARGGDPNSESFN